MNITQKKENRRVGTLQAVGEWTPTNNGRVKVPMTIDNTPFSFYAATAIQLENIMQPLELNKEVEYTWVNRTYKGREYSIIQTIKPYLKQPGLIEAVKEAQNEELEELIRARGELEAKIKKLQHEALKRDVEAFI